MPRKNEDEHISELFLLKSRGLTMAESAIAASKKTTQRAVSHVWSKHRAPSEAYIAEVDEVLGPLSKQIKEPYIGNLRAYILSATRHRPDAERIRDAWMRQAGKCYLSGTLLFQDSKSRAVFYDEKLIHRLVYGRLMGTATAPNTPGLRRNLTPNLGAFVQMCEKVVKTGPKV